MSLPRRRFPSRVYTTFNELPEAYPQEQISRWPAKEAACIGPRYFNRLL